MLEQKFFSIPELDFLVDIITVQCHLLLKSFYIQYLCLHSLVMYPLAGIVLMCLRFGTLGQTRVAK